MFRQSSIEMWIQNGFISMLFVMPVWRRKADSFGGFVLGWRKRSRLWPRLLFELERAGKTEPNLSRMLQLQLSGDGLRPVIRALQNLEVVARTATVKCDFSGLVISTTDDASSFVASVCLPNDVRLFDSYTCDEQDFATIVVDDLLFLLRGAGNDEYVVISNHVDNRISYVRINYNNQAGVVQRTRYLPFCDLPRHGELFFTDVPPVFDTFAMDMDIDLFREFLESNLYCPEANVTVMNRTEALLSTSIGSLHLEDIDDDPYSPWAVIFEPSDERTNEMMIMNLRGTSSSILAALDPQPELPHHVHPSVQLAKMADGNCLVVCPLDGHISMRYFLIFGNI